MPQTPKLKKQRIPVQQISKVQDSRVSGVTRKSQSVTVKRSAASLLWIIVLLSSGGLVAGGIWLSLQLFINPDALSSINYLLPEWAKIPSVNPQPQTLKQIQASLSKQGQILGEPLKLESTLQSTFLIPVLSSQQIVELRVYELTSIVAGQKPQAEIQYQLIDQVSIAGIEESFAIAPLLTGEVADSGSSRLLPLTQLRRFEGTTPAGIWFYLWGERIQGTRAIAYGQIIHYNPSRSHLNLMLPWTSTIGQPQWQQVTSSGSPELVVNQTIDLEPQLRVYQVKPAQYFLDPVQLEPISLAEPALNNSAYQKAILLARTGLWTPAWQWLQFIKQQHKWSTAAQAQMDLIKLYAQLTNSQAQKAWASPSQEVLAKLIDGRWSEGLQVFQKSSIEDTQEIATLLAADTGRLGNRVDVALRINSARLEVKAWGALITGAKEGRQQAIAWLKQQPKTTQANITYVQNLLKRLEGDFSTPKISASHPSRIIGSVQPITKINLKEWLQLNQTPLKETDTYWYQIQISAYHDGKNWQQSPFPNLLPVKSLWQQLGLDTDSQIQLITWLPDGQQKITIATVKAVQLRGGVLKLLAAAAEKINETDLSLQRSPLALTQAALEWVQAESVTLADLSQQEQPVELAAILPALWQEIQKSSPTKTSVPSFEQLFQNFGQLPAQLIDLTGDNLAEVVITIPAETISALNNSQLDQAKLARMRTIIFSSTGKVLYSEFSRASQQTVIAIADLKDDAPPALLVKSSSYSFQRWSAKHQRFQ